MKSKIIIVVFFLSLGFFVKAQNFVYNGEFEVYDTCVTNPGQISYAVGWKSCTETPDYYNSCSNGANMKVPHTFHGFQKDCCGGSGYAGGFMFNANGDSARDYIYTKLIDTLKPGHKYLTSMYVNLNDVVDYAVATLGILFTDTPTVVSYAQGFIAASPQVKNTSVITDTSGWTLIQDTITAVGNEVYLTIGNFNIGKTSDTVRVGNYPYNFIIAYYYFDNVSVYDVETLGAQQLKEKKEELTVFPNPSNGVFSVQYNFKEDAKMEITDINGTLVGKYNLPANDTKLEIRNDNLSNGIYLYRIISDKPITGKIVIMK
ncbi:MAG: T9SS type A sorting domain-containing protein [Bacteroidia bacterium]